MTTTEKRSLQTPLLLIGVRCIARYVVLPFVLPFVAVAAGPMREVLTGAALGILLILDLAAILSMAVTLRWLWRHQHPRRWHYLAVALALAMLIALFLVNDTRALFA